MVGGGWGEVVLHIGVMCTMTTPRKLFRMVLSPLRMVALSSQKMQRWI